MSLKNEEHDIVIIGGGPAGAAAAYYMGRRGFDVLLLESKSYPRPKPCGDGVGPRAVLALRDMGLEPWLESNHVHRVERLRIVASSGASIISVADEDLFPIVYGYIIKRSIFDRKLIEHAKAHGAKVLENWRVESLQEDGARTVGVSGVHNGAPAGVKAKLVVVADGSKGRISRLFGPKISAIQAIGMRTYASEIEGIDDCANIYFTRDFPKGYAWIFPNSPTSANIGVGVLHLNKRSGTHIHQAYDYFVNRQDLSPISLRDSVIEGAPMGSVMRMNYGLRNIHRPGLAFIGDSAGLVSPINGEGISHAIESGKLLSDSLPDKLADNRSIDRALVDYERAMKRKFLWLFHLGRIFNLVFGTPNHLDRAIAKAAKHDELRVILAAVLANAAHPRELLRPKIFTKLFY